MERPQDRPGEAAAPIEIVRATPLDDPIIRTLVPRRMPAAPRALGGPENA
jgi:hypothetical protein